jgi:putative NADPH-quinone reductase
LPQRILVIDGHPDPDRTRFCHALADAYVHGAMAAGKETRLITLAETPVDFVRSAMEFASAPQSTHILSARADIEWADHLTLVFPLWLGGAPALLRAFLEQVARGEFFAAAAASGPRPKFKGKSARIVVTMGMPAFIYRTLFSAHGVRNIIQGVLGFAGFTPIKTTMFGAMESAREPVQKARLAQVHLLGREGR